MLLNYVHCMWESASVLDLHLLLTELGRHLPLLQLPHLSFVAAREKMAEEFIRLANRLGPNPDFHVHLWQYCYPIIKQWTIV